MRYSWARGPPTPDAVLPVTVSSGKGVRTTTLILFYASRDREAVFRVSERSYRMLLYPEQILVRVASSRRFCRWYGVWRAFSRPRSRSPGFR